MSFVTSSYLLAFVLVVLSFKLAMGHLVASPCPKTCPEGLVSYSGIHLSHMDLKIQHFLHLPLASINFRRV
jgi:hypothetical protein